MNEIVKYIAKLAKREDLSYDEISRIIQIILLGGATPAQISALLMGFKVKGETKEELTSVIHIIQDTFLKNIELENIDNYLSISSNFTTCSSYSNILITVEFIVASLGQKIFINLERQAYYNPIEFLENFGIIYKFDTKFIEDILKELNIGLFITDRNYLLNNDLIIVKDEIAIHDIFDLVKPFILKPLGVKYRLIRLKFKNEFELYKNLLRSEKNVKTWLIYNDDEDIIISNDHPNYFVEIYDGQVKEFVIDKIDLDVKENKYSSNFDYPEFTNLFNGQAAACKKTIILTSSVALYLMDYANSVEEGVKLVIELIESKNVKNTIKKLVEVTNYIV